MSTPIAIAHDYLTQRGGAERVVLSLARAYPQAPIHTSLYLPGGTFPEFGQRDVRTAPINRIGLLRRHHRWALPWLAGTFSSMEVEADVVLCSSSGWAHGVQTAGRKIVYCYTPARWLYQPEHYRGGLMGSLAVRVLGERLRRWDRRAARSADRYIAISTVVRERIRQVYGRDAPVVFPPHGAEPEGRQEPVVGVGAGYLLVVSRLLPYKNVDAVVAAAGTTERLVVVGAGPRLQALRSRAPDNVVFLSGVGDAQLRWLYANCRMVVAASYEDLGLVPLEAAAFGRPTVALRWGGFLDTVVPEETGLFFDEPVPADIRRAVAAADRVIWSEERLRAQAARFSEAEFLRRLREAAGLRLARAS